MVTFHCGSDSWIFTVLLLNFLPIYSLFFVIPNAPVKLFCPHPPGHPRRHQFFFGCPGLLITLFLPYPALYKHSNHSCVQCPALFYHTHFSSEPGAAPGDGGRTIDRRISFYVIYGKHTVALLVI